MSIDIRVLASGSGGNCYRISDGETALLLEAGIRFSDIRKGLNFTLSDIAGVCITHEHNDHAMAAKDVLKAGVDIYASHGTIDALGLKGYRVNAVRAQEQFVVGTWAILPFEAFHDAEEPLGFLLASKHGGKLMYLTDSGFCAYRFNGITHFMVEANWSEEIIRKNIEDGHVSSALYRRVVANHMSLERTIEMLKANDLSKVEAIHLLHLSETNADEEAFKTAVMRATGKPVYIAGR